MKEGPERRAATLSTRRTVKKEWQAAWLLSSGDSGADVAVATAKFWAAEAGHRVELARDVVDHRLGTRTFRDLRARQIRWNLGIRTSRPWGYAGLVFTQGTAASLFFLLATGGSALGWSVAGLTLAVRLGVAWFLAARAFGPRAALLTTLVALDRTVKDAGFEEMSL